MTFVTDTILANQYSHPAGLDLGGDYVIAPASGLHQGSNESSGYSFILVLACMALAVVVASVIFTPAPASGFGDMLFVGP